MKQILLALTPRLLTPLTTALWLGLSVTVAPEFVPGLLPIAHANQGFVVRRASTPKNTTIIVAPGSVFVGGSRSPRYSQPYSNSRYSDPYYSRNGRNRTVRCNDRPSGIVVITPRTQVRVNRVGSGSSSDRDYRPGYGSNGTYSSGGYSYSSYSNGDYSNDSLYDSNGYPRMDSQNSSDTYNFSVTGVNGEAGTYSNDPGYDSNGYWTEFRVPGLQSGF